MTTTSVSAIATTVSILATVALTYFGIPARVNCTVAAATHVVAYALTGPL